MTPSEILQKHEDANEMHLHHIDKKWVVEAMEEYALKSATQMFQDAIADAYSTGWHDGQDVIINQIKHVDKGGDELGIKHFKKHFK